MPKPFLVEDASSAALLQMASSHEQSDDLDKAERCYRRVLKRDPGNVQALQRLARLLRAQESRAGEALGLLVAALAAEPHNAGLHAARAALLNALERRLEAFEGFAQACCLTPGDPGSLYNLGLQAADLCCPHLTQALAHHLLGVLPDWPAAHYLRLRALTSLDADAGEIDQLYRTLIKSDPLNVPLRFARGLAQLKRGDYASGWEAQEWRWDIEPVKSSRPMFARPRWAGGSLQGRRLLVCGEQGFGDILQFARYLPLLVARGARVILRLDDNRAGLSRLLARMDGVDIVVGCERAPSFDLYCTLASLPYLFDTTVDTIPEPPYLSIDEAEVAAWRQRLRHLPRPWVGLCWAGSDDHFHNVRRSLPLWPGSRFDAERQARERRIEAAVQSIAQACGLPQLNEAARQDAIPSSWTMAPVLQRTAGSFISLQLGPRVNEIDALPAGLRNRINAPLPAQADFHETACLALVLDEIITVDTSVAHLCGAVGQKGTIILPHAPEWRWIERNGMSAWYPRMRLVTQRDAAAS